MNNKEFSKIFNADTNDLAEGALTNEHINLVIEQIGEDNFRDICDNMIGNFKNRRFYKLLKKKFLDDEEKLKKKQYEIATKVNIEKILKKLGKFKGEETKCPFCGSMNGSKFIFKENVFGCKDCQLIGGPIELYKEISKKNYFETIKCLNNLEKKKHEKPRHKMQFS